MLPAVIFLQKFSTDEESHLSMMAGFCLFLCLRCYKNTLFYCIRTQICTEFSDLIGWKAVRTGAYGLAYGPANCRSITRHQICYFRRVIGEISSVRMWSSIWSLPYFKSNVRHEEIVLVSSMLFQISDCVKTFKIMFSQIKSVFQVYQCMAGLFPKEEEYTNSWIIFVNIYLDHP